MALKIDSKNAAAYNGIGLAYDRLNQHEKSL